MGPLSTHTRGSHRMKETWASRTLRGSVRQDWCTDKCHVGRSLLRDCTLPWTGCGSLGKPAHGSVPLSSSTKRGLCLHHRSPPTWSSVPSVSSVQSLSRVRLFATPQIAARQASLSITNSRSLLKLMSMSWWCHPTISSSVIPFSSCLQSLPASGSFLVSQFFASGGQSTGVSASASVLPMNTQDWSPFLSSLLLLPQDWAKTWLWEVLSSPVGRVGHPLPSSAISPPTTLLPCSSQSVFCACVLCLGWQARDKTGALAGHVPGSCLYVFAE